MATLEQERALLAFKHVGEFQVGSPDAKKYATIVHKMPALLVSAGLCQALHFVDARRDQNQKKLLDHLAEQLKRVDATISGKDDLLARVRSAELGQYLQLMREAYACAGWYRRLVQGVLKIEAGTDTGEG